MTDEYTSAKNSFAVHAADPRAGVEILFADWQRLRKASALVTPDPLSALSFADVIERVIDARTSGKALVLTTAANAKPATTSN